ncbi:TonB-dependent receptor [Haliea atlantica]
MPTMINRLAVLPTLALASLAATAQPAPALEEVVVTAQKRTENLQDVPVSIAAFGARELETFQISGVQDIATFTPGMISVPQAESGGGLRIAIRGVIPSGASLGLDSRVAIYVDSAYVGKGSGAVFDMVDLERVEVLKGPQGTLYGRNAVAGAINLIPAKAHFEGVSGSVSAGMGNFDRQELKGSINLPLTDTLAVKLSGMRHRRDGWVENRGLGEDFMGYDRHGLRLDMAWQPSDSVRIDYAYDNLTANSTPTYYQSIPEGTGGAFAALLLPPFGHGRRDSVDSAIDIPEVEVEARSHTVTANWDWATHHSTKLVASHRQLDSTRWSGFFTESPINPLAGFDRIFASNAPETDVDDHEQYSLEFNATGTLGETLEYVAGLYYFDEDTGSGQPHYTTSDVPFLSGTHNQARFKTEALAAFGRMSWSPDALGQKLTLTAGLRVSHDEREATAKTFAQVVDASTPPLRIIGGVPIASLSSDDSWDSVDPEVIAEYQLADDTMLYAKYSTAFRSGGFNESATALDTFTFDKEEIEAWELGIKSTLFNGRLRANAATFLYEIDGLQQVISHPQIPNILTVGNSTAETSGFELDLTAQLTEHFSASLAYAYLDTEADDIRVVFDVPQRLVVDFPSGSAGNPRNSLSINLDYARSLSDLGEAYAHLGFNHTDSFFVTTNNARLDARDILNARIGLREISVGTGMLSLGLWSQNLTDNEYHIDRIEFSTFGSVGLGYDVVAFGTPRTYGLDVKYDF